MTDGTVVGLSDASASHWRHVASPGIGLQDGPRSGRLHRPACTRSRPARRCRQIPAAGEKGIHRDLVGGVEHRRCRAARGRWPPGPGAGRERPSSGASKSSRATGTGRGPRPRHRCAPARPGRRRWACACRDCPAAPAPTRRCRRPWSESRSGDAPPPAPARARIEQPARLDQLQPLVHQGGASPPRSCVPWTSWGGRRPAPASPGQPSGVQPRKGPPEAVSSSTGDAVRPGPRDAPRVDTGRWHCVRNRWAAGCHAGATASMNRAAGHHQGLLVGQQHPLAGSRTAASPVGSSPAAPTSAAITTSAPQACRRHRPTTPPE
jgi:hypothetical protein